jgi:hypothetical protein
MRGLETISDPEGRVEEEGIGDGWRVWDGGLVVLKDGKMVFEMDVGSDVGAVSFAVVLLFGFGDLSVEVWENGGARALGGPGLGPAGTAPPPSLYARGLDGRPASLGATPGFGLFIFVLPAANAA